MTLAMKLQDMKYEGRQEGRLEGEKNTFLANLKAIMKKLNISADEAMDTLDVPEKDRQEYRRLLEQ